MQISIYLWFLLSFFFYLNCSSADKTGTKNYPVPTDGTTSSEISVSDKKETSIGGASGKKTGPAKPSTEGAVSDLDSVADYSPPKNQDSSSGLKAGYADDNKQFNYFLNFLQKFKYAKHIPLDISERISIKVKDGNNKYLVNAKMKIYQRSRKNIETCSNSSDCSLLEEGTTYSDGSYLFFPSEHGKQIPEYIAEAEYGQIKSSILIDRNGTRNREIILKSAVKSQNTPMDIVFVLDTTGSMGKEIRRLISTIELIHMNLTSLKGADLQFGFVLYRDKGEEYITKVIDLTSDIKTFKEELSKVAVDGGGDYPEDLQSALKDSIHSIKWRKNAVKLNFVITDAPPHLDYGQSFTYISAAKAAKKQGIKYYTIGTGGLDVNGEYVLRQLAQYTSAKYIFLTYGEKGESDGGAPGSVSHHTGENFSTDKLESIIIRFAKEEYSNAIDKPLEVGDSYFSGQKIDSEKKEDTIRKLFEKGASQLLDFSTVRIEQGTTLGILPTSLDDKKYAKVSEYFGEQLLVTCAQNKNFKLVERKNMQSLYNEWKLNQSLGIEGEKAVQIGKTLGAKILLVSNLYKKKSDYEIFLKLVHSETGEILSVTKLVVDEKLGI